MPGSHKKSPPPGQRPAIDDLCEETFRPLANLNDNRNVGIWVEGILKSRLGSSELRVLERLIRTNDELLFSTFKVFENERDEEEMVDTVLRIVQKYEALEEQKGEDEGRNEEALKESYFKSKKGLEESVVGSGQKPAEKQRIGEKSGEKTNAGGKREEQVEKERKNEGNPEKKAEKGDEVPQKMALSVIFNVNILIISLIFLIISPD